MYGVYDKYDWTTFDNYVSLHGEPVNENKIGIDFTQTVLPDGHVQLQVTQGLDQVAQVSFEMYVYIDQFDILCYLGSDNDMTGSYETGEFTDNFQCDWLTIDGNYVSATLSEQGDGYNLYYIPINLDSPDDYMEVCFGESIMLRRLAYYPYVQLGVVLIFVVVAIFALLSSKRAEQNKVWVGLSKETAHQLGTPISSLMAWVEVLKETHPDDELIPEMDKDVRRLQRIAERFSKIGSLPEPKPENLNDVVQNVVEYIGRRTSNKVTLAVDMPDHPLIVKMSAPLFEWVVENLCKNAIDAMEGRGSITITARDEADCFSVEVSDTGKGIPKNKFRDVFMPGFTTKSRGWGLGLSLAKRIVEEYHGGRIFVKSSELGRGTTFRIELRRN